MVLALGNLPWMAYNIILAIIPIFVGIRMEKEKKTLLKVLYGIGWLLFIPNSLYMVTDIIHLMKDWYIAASVVEQLLLLGEYTALMAISIVTFVLALCPFERVLKQKKIGKEQRNAIIFGLNFLIAFGIVLGRIHRLNSWDIVTNIEGIIKSSFETVTSSQMLVLTVFFGILGNCIYFFFKKTRLR